MGLESMSEPDDLDSNDDDEGDGVGVEANENDNDDKPFSDTQSAGSRGGRSTRIRLEVKMLTRESDPVGTAKPRLKKSEEDDSESEDNDGDGDGRGRRGFGDDDIEDDWADPLVLDSNPVPSRGKDTSASPSSSSNVSPLAKGS